MNEGKKKGGKLKWIIVAVIVIIIIAAIGGSGDSEKKPADKKADSSAASEKSQEESKPEEPKQEEPVPEEAKTEHFEIDLTAGHYTAGIDIPAGIYNLTATSGTGNVNSSNMFDGGLNEVMGTPADDYTVETFNGVKLEENTTLSLTSSVVLHLVSENAAVSSMKARGASAAAPIDLTAGHYTAGTDFPAGTYNIVATGGSGNVNSDNMFDGGLNEIMGTENDGFSIQHFNNANFKEGATLTISSTSVQLIPVAE